MWVENRKREVMGKMKWMDIYENNLDGRCYSLKRRN